MAGCSPTPGAPALCPWRVHAVHHPTRGQAGLGIARWLVHAVVRLSRFNSGLQVPGHGKSEPGYFAPERRSVS